MRFLAFNLIYLLLSSAFDPFNNKIVLIKAGFFENLLNIRKRPRSVRFSFNPVIGLNCFPHFQPRIFYKNKLSRITQRGTQFKICPRITFPKFFRKASTVSMERLL